VPYLRRLLDGQSIEDGIVEFAQGTSFGDPAAVAGIDTSAGGQDVGGVRDESLGVGGAYSRRPGQYVRPGRTLGGRLQMRAPADGATVERAESEVYNRYVRGRQFGR